MDQEQAALTVPRSGWVAALCIHPAQELIALAAALSKGWQVRPKALPQAGLTMLRMRESVYGEEFYLGELPFASAWVEITLPDGTLAEGAAPVMSDYEGLSTALAICDAVLANRLPGYQRVVGLVEEGAQWQAEQRYARRLMLIKTRVRFDGLEEAR
jgi:alpha-D-ribose 1-methylphosphonate 5-triphosphate synthase subunit PhnG